jgi:hypothetical protein
MDAMAHRLFGATLRTSVSAQLATPAPLPRTVSG